MICCIGLQKINFPMKLKAYDSRIPDLYCLSTSNNQNLFFELQSRGFNCIHGPMAHCRHYFSMTIEGQTATNKKHIYLHMIGRCAESPQKNTTLNFFLKTNKLLYHIKSLTFHRKRLLKKRGLVHQSMGQKRVSKKPYWLKEKSTNTCGFTLWVLVYILSASR